VSAAVSALSVVPVKGMRLQAPERLELDRGGAAAVGDRAYYVIDERGRMINGKHVGELSTVLASATPDRLRLEFPDGRVIEDVVREGEPVRTRFYSRMREDRLVEGPWSDALSDLLGRPVRLVRAAGPGRAVDRGVHGAVSLVSAASVRELAAHAEVHDVDARRFRMLIEVDGVEAHAEDAWVGRRVRVGSAVVRFRGHVGRCLITSRDPDTGEIDLPTLDILEGYRGDVRSTEPLPFGIYGEVLEPGAVAVGDSAAVE